MGSTALTAETLHQKLSELPARAGRAAPASRLNASLPPVLPRSGAPATARLSSAQERLWFLDQMAPGNPTYNVLHVHRMRGPLDVAALEHSLAAVAARHAILRTTFTFEAGRPQQVIAASQPPVFIVDDASALPASERETAVVAFAAAAGDHAFDLSTGPLWLARLLRLAPDDHALAFTLHHAIFDGLSLPILFDELEELYAAFHDGRAASLPPLPIQYADYAEWEREQSRSQSAAADLDYWKEQLRGAPPVLELPADRPRPRTPSQAGLAVDRLVPAGLQARLTALARREDATTFMVLLAAFDVLLTRLTGQYDVVVGAPIAGRQRPELARLIGDFINSLALRADLSGDPTFTELVRRVRAMARSAYAHQSLPFGTLLAALEAERSASYTPVFQVQINRLRTRNRPLRLAGIDAPRIYPPGRPALFDLTLYISDEPGGLGLSAVYAVDLFDEPRIAALMDAYLALLEQVAADADRRISELSLVTPVARAVLPDPAQPLSDAWEGAIHARLTEQARRSPEHTAMLAAGERWTYAELEARANRLAQALLAQGVQRGEVVAIYAQRTPALVWAILGVLKAGAATLILDPAYPAARLQDYLSLARPRALLRLEAAGNLPPGLAEFIQTLDLRCSFTLPGGVAVPAFLAPYPAEAPQVAIGPDDLACVSFTSGSTGRPKGVLGRHGPLTHFLPWQMRAFDYTPSTRFSLMSGLSHDPLQRDIFTAIWAGGTLCIPEAGAWHTPGRLAAWLAESRINCAHLTPPLSQLIVEGTSPELSLPDLQLGVLRGRQTGPHRRGPPAGAGAQRGLLQLVWRHRNPARRRLLPRAAHVGSRPWPRHLPCWARHARCSAPGAHGHPPDGGRERAGRDLCPQPSPGARLSG